MKRNLLLVIVVISVIIMSLSACGNAGGKETPADMFSDRIKTISAENSELAGYSMDPLMDQGKGLYGASVHVDGKTVGAITIHVDGEQITEFAFSFSASGPTQREYRQPIIASAMALDSSLDYSAAKDIAATIDSILLFGEAPVEHNGYTYSAQWRDDDMIFVRIAK